MNQNRKYTTNRYYDAEAGNIRTVNGETVEIDHQLIIADLPPDISNDDMISVDNLGRLYKLPKSSLTGAFDQDLNTFNDVKFNKINIPNTTQLNNNVNRQVEVNRAGIASIVLNADGGQYPKLTFSDKYILSGSGQETSFLTFGAYNQSDPIGTFTASDTNYIGWERKHGENRLIFFASKTPQTPGSPVNSFSNILIMSPELTGIYSDRLDIHSEIHWVNVDNHTLDGNVPVRQTDGYVKRTGVVIDASNNITTTGTISTITADVPPEIPIDKVIIKSGGTNTLMGTSPTNLFLQNLTPSSNVEFSTVDTGQGQNSLYPMNQDVLTTSNVTFNNIFSNGLVQTDQILENTLNGGVSITSWNIKGQSLTSNSIVSVNDPLRIDFKISGDNDNLIQIYAKDHDNTGLMFDCNKDDIGDDNTLVSGSTNANVFINKELGSLKFLITNAITKGQQFLKSTMNNVMELGKTYINLNESVTMAQSLVLNGLPTSTNNTVLLTKFPGTNEIQQQDGPKYDYSFFENNIVSTTINTINIYERVVYAPITFQTGDSLFTITNDAGNLLYTYTGLTKKVNISINFNVHKNGGGNELYQFEVRVNGVKAGPSPKQKLEDNTKWQMLSVDGILILNPGDLITFWVRCETGTDNINVSGMTITAYQLI